MVKATVVKAAPDDQAAPLNTNKGTSSTKQTPKGKLKLAEIVVSPNVAELLEKGLVEQMGSAAVEGYRSDRSSRQEWEERNAEAMKLALQVTEQKSFPWAGCANVKFPLITVAALQFLARVSILTKGKSPVKCIAFGADPDGTSAATAKRVSNHMSYQITEEDVNWMDEDEKAKFCASLLGCAFKKTSFDSVQGLMTGEFLAPQNFVVDYWTKDLATCKRATNLLSWSLNKIRECERSGMFLEMDDTPPSPRTETNVLAQAKDESQGTQESADGAQSNYDILEQYMWADLDGDGYEEPYITYVRLDTKQCLRIVARFFDEGDVIRKNDPLVRKLEAKAKDAKDREEKNQIESKIAELKTSPTNDIVRIVPVESITKYTFIPAPDGGFYDLGFGALLGPTNESVNTLINQLLDAGTMATTAGGFLGRGVKIKGGQTSFDPFEWKPVDSTGDDLRKNIFPLPVREPSPTLFQLLGLLIQYGEKISGATDIMTGVSPGQNTPAETSRNTIEQGMKIFSGIFTRMHRGMASELRKLYKLNQLYLSSTPQWDQLTEGPTAMISPKDYVGGVARVRPSVDPTMVSEAQRQTNATMVLQMANTQPGYDKYLANLEVLEAYGVSNIDSLLPDPKGPKAIQPTPNPKFELEKQKLELQKQQMQLDQQTAMIELQQDQLLQQAKITQLQAQATKLLAEAAGVDTGHQIALLNAQIGAAKAHEESIHRALQIMQKSIEQRQSAAKEGVNREGTEKPGEQAARMAGMGAASDNAGAAQEPQGQPG